MAHKVPDRFKGGYRGSGDTPPKRPASAGASINPPRSRSAKSARVVKNASPRKSA